MCLFFSWQPSCSFTGDVEAESGDVAALPSQGTEKEDPAATTVRAVVLEYLALAHGGDPPGDLDDDTPFMEAGLDSLDLLKVNKRENPAFVDCQNLTLFECSESLGGWCMSNMNYNLYVLE